MSTVEQPTVHDMCKDARHAVVQQISIVAPFLQSLDDGCALILDVKPAVATTGTDDTDRIGDNGGKAIIDRRLRQ